MRSLELRLHRSSGTLDLRVTATSLVVAGWTGRDRAALDEHILELEALGVSRPRTVPVFYRLATSLLAQESVIEVLGQRSSGEAEAVIMAFGGELWLGIGSDHTDRRLETVSIAASKQLCAKPLGREIWPLGQVIEHWDELILRSFVCDGAVREPYQAGPLRSNLAATELIALYTSGGGLEDGTVMFCGTLPVIGTFRCASRFELELEDPVLARSLRHSYEIRQLPDPERTA